MNEPLFVSPNGKEICVICHARKPTWTSRRRFLRASTMWKDAASTARNVAANELSANP